MTHEHFRVAGEAKGYTWPRVICGARGRVRTGGWPGTLEVRSNAMVSCPTCMVYKDKWLELGKPRLTLRRCRSLFPKGARP